MKYLRLGAQFLAFLLLYFAIYALYQLPDSPTKFIYYNF